MSSTIKENLYLLESLLKAHGYHVITAHNGAEALGLAAKRPPDLIIADILMPVMDGYSLCREWMKDKRLEHIPFIFYTATYTHPKDRKFALSLGATKFIIKPQEPDVFMDIIETALTEFAKYGTNANSQVQTSEVTILKQYNETLIRKMEERMHKSEEAERKIRNYAAQLENEIEQRKEIEADLIISKEKAEESDQLKTAFLAKISHEIRTPMNGILGFLELITEPDLDSEQLEIYKGIMVQSSDRLLETINNIVEVAKAESGQITITETQVNVCELLAHNQDSFKEKADNKGILLKLSKECLNSDITIKTDKFKLGAILNNLLSNAIKYTEEGEIEFGFNLEEKDLVFFVKDTGFGIPADQQELIFERFVQVERTYTHPSEGTGLGLTIVQAYLEKMKGKIWVESELGKGSTFYFSLEHKKSYDASH